jgi:hypothetical protein
MSGLKHAYHGRSHLPGGSDPIPGLTDSAPVWGQINRDGGAGSMSITSGALNATTTLIAHNVVLEEVGVDCDIVSSPTRITILEAGLYIIRSALTDVDSGGADYGLSVGFGLNATGAVWAAANVVRRTIGGFAVPQSHNFVALDVGDYVTQAVGQDSGSTKTGGYLALLTIARIPGLAA